MISAEQFQEWKNHPVTKEFFIELRKTRKALEDKLVNGNTICQTAEETHGLTNRTVGNIAGIDQILNSYFDDESVSIDVNEISGY